jgi:hypothetical protein
MRPLAALLAPIAVVATPFGPVVGGDAPAPDQIQIVSASTSGNGCPQGTVTADLSVDRTV